MLTSEILCRTMPGLPRAQADLMLPHLLAAMQEFEINTLNRRRAFLAQLAHESLDLTAWTENCNYRADRLLKVFKNYFTRAQAQAYAHKPQQIASRVYANRLGNGDEGSLDGWRYRGRSPVHVTGRDNYRDCGIALGLPLLKTPELLALPQHGFRAAGWFWSTRQLNELADKLVGSYPADERIYKKITFRINGGFNGLPDRVLRYKRAINSRTQ